MTGFVDSLYGTFLPLEFEQTYRPYQNGNKVEYLTSQKVDNHQDTMLKVCTETLGGSCLFPSSLAMSGKEVVDPVA